jgi:hypothetical protein
MSRARGIRDRSPRSPELPIFPKVDFRNSGHTVCASSQFAATVSRENNMIRNTVEVGSSLVMVDGDDRRSLQSQDV